VISFPLEEVSLDLVYGFSFNLKKGGSLFPFLGF
jgi:hypothetical protein